MQIQIGFIYNDYFSRFIVGWGLSNSLDSFPFIQLKNGIGGIKISRYYRISYLGMIKSLVIYKEL